MSSKTENQANGEKWDMVITARSKFFTLQLKDLWRYRDLVFMFVKRDFVALYKQTILGPLWYLIQPLLSTTIFTVIFGRIANIPTDGVPHFIFYLSGIICWNYFSECLVATSNTFIANASIFGKVYFPRLAVPVSVVLSNLIKFGIQMSLFVAFYIFFALKGFEFRPGIFLLYVPLLILQMALLGLGFGILISSLTTKYRDLTLLVGFGVQLWMYATPVVYPFSQVPEKFRYLYSFNPMSSVITNFRAITIGSEHFNGIDTALSWGTTLIVLFVGMIIFNRVEKNFMDTV